MSHSTNQEKNGNCNKNETPVQLTAPGMSVYSWDLSNSSVMPALLSTPSPIQKTTRWG